MEYITAYFLLMKGTLKRIASQARVLDFQRAGVQTLEKGHINIKRKRNEYKSYIGDNFLMIRSFKIRYTCGCRK